VQAWQGVTVVGALAELLGILAVAVPDLLPGARRLSAWLGRSARRSHNLLLRLIGRPPRAFALHASAGVYTVKGGSVTGVVGTSATTLEGKVEYLLRRDQDTQQMLADHAARLRRLEEESPRRLAELQRQMETHVEDELTSARARRSGRFGSRARSRSRSASSASPSRRSSRDARGGGGRSGRERAGQ
jgi:hypothetical protein